MTEGYPSLEFTPDFLKSWEDRKLTAQDRAHLLRALRTLDSDEKHQSLKIHALRGHMEGYWSAAASDSLRIEFRRLPGGRKLLIRCTKHYDR